MTARSRLHDLWNARGRPLVAATRDALVRHSPLPRESEGPQSRAAIVGWLVVQLVALGAFAATLYKTLDPLFEEPRPYAVRPAGPGDQKFEVDEKTRKAIFAELAALEIHERKRNIEQNTWQGHLWSREDDRGYQEMTLARQLAAARKISLTQVFLILDEGIKNHWPGPDGKPLPATAEPLNLRTGW